MMMLRRVKGADIKITTANVIMLMRKMMSSHVAAFLQGVLYMILTVSSCVEIANYNALYVYMMNVILIVCDLKVSQSFCFCCCRASNGYPGKHTHVHAYVCIYTRACKQTHPRVQCIQTCIHTNTHATHTHAPFLICNESHNIHIWDCVYK